MHTIGVYCSGHYPHIQKELRTTLNNFIVAYSTEKYCPEQYFSLVEQPLKLCLNLNGPDRLSKG